MHNRGKIRTTKNYDTGKWHVQGKKNGLWIDVTDEWRESLGQSKDLIFDLEYDACSYVEMFNEFLHEQSAKAYFARMKKQKNITMANVQLTEKQLAKKKKRKAISKKSQRRNRSKK